MKSLPTLFVILFLFLRSEAKYVEFSVNMGNEIISTNGVHVSGDFQAAAGFTGGNWNPATALLAKVGNSRIYHIILNIPAKKKYEYKYVNGDQFYESEYVPDESRVGYMFNDNRWFYLDSLSNDTFQLPTLIFSTNAPLTKKLLRFRVGMYGISVNSNGVHVAGSYNNFDPSVNYMYSFDGKIYEYITYIDTLTPDVEYRFANGNTGAQFETVPSACNVFSNREVDFSHDTVILICYGACGPCVNGINDKKYSSSVSINPNPVQTSATISLNNIDQDDIFVYDGCGRLVRTYFNIEGNFKINKDELNSGIYFIQTGSGEKIKFIIE